MFGRSQVSDVHGTDAVFSEPLGTVKSGERGVARPSAWSLGEWDVVVIGGGNAAVVSALAADDLGARVLILERAPVRCAAATPGTPATSAACTSRRLQLGPYTFDELWDDLCSVGEGPNDEELARFTVRESESVPAWMDAHGARWQRPLAGTLHLGRTNRFFLGGGKALLNSYYRYVATRPRVSVDYDAKVEEIEFDGDCCTGLVVAAGRRPPGPCTPPGAVICASGGFEANLDWLRRYWGDAVDNYSSADPVQRRARPAGALRRGRGHRRARRRGFHAIAVDARAPEFDGGIATRLDTIPFGIVGQQARPPLLRRGRGHLAQAVRDLGPQHRRAARPDRLPLWDAKVNRLVPAAHVRRHRGGEHR